MYETKIIEAKTLAQAWEESCKLVMKQGHTRYVQAPEYQIETKDLPLMIKVSDPFAEPRLSDKANTTKELAEDYRNKFLNGSGRRMRTALTIHIIQG